MDKNIFVTKAIFVEKDVIQNNKKGEKGFYKKIRKISFFVFGKTDFFLTKKTRKND